jgi:hypothetical protein
VTGSVSDEQRPVVQHGQVAVVEGELVVGRCTQVLVGHQDRRLAKHLEQQQRVVGRRCREVIVAVAVHSGNLRRDEEFRIGFTLRICQEYLTDGSTVNQMPGNRSRI